MADVKALKEKATNLRKLLKQVESVPGVGKEASRSRDAERKREDRAADKDVLIRDCADIERRRLLESDIFEWLRWYGGDEFTRDFTDQQREMILAIYNAMHKALDKSIAGPRGEGKSSICEWVLMFGVLTGLVQFAVLFAATGEDAENSLKSIRERFEENDRLADDYPEVCDPIRALENTAQRARTQTVSGKRADTGEVFQRVPTKFSWCGREIRFPNVPGSIAAKAIIATRGLDAAVRGMKRGKDRPQIAVIDDPDTEETVNSEDQRKKLLKKIDRNIAGLAGQSRRCSRVVLTTIQSQACASAMLTDSEIYPSFDGQRFPFLITPPENMGLWEEYIALRQIDLSQKTTFALDFYVKNREAMDAGAVVGNIHRRGDANELSALQFYFNEVARVGQDAVDSELQNNPSQDTGPIESGITAFRICKKLSGVGKSIIPFGCTVLSQGIDVGKRYLHWVVRAWRPDGTAFYTIDYGTKETYGTVAGSEEGLDDAIRLALIERMEETREANYENERGEILKVGMTLVDARYRTAAIYATCAELGLGIRPVMGYGKSAGCVRVNFHDLLARTKDKKPGGDGWFESRQKTGSKDVWLVNIHADHWKAWEHDRWMTPADKPGSMFLYGMAGDDPKRITGDELEHKRSHYPDHICAEVEVEETIDGVVKRYWKAKGENHWLDASSYSNVAAHMLGISLHGSQVRKTRAVPMNQRPSARDLAARNKSA